MEPRAYFLGWVGFPRATAISMTSGMPAADFKVTSSPESLVATAVSFVPEVDSHSRSSVGSTATRTFANNRKTKNKPGILIPPILASPSADCHPNVRSPSTFPLSPTLCPPSADGGSGGPSHDAETALPKAAKNSPKVDRALRARCQDGAAGGSQDSSASSGRKIHRARDRTIHLLTHELLPRPSSAPTSQGNHSPSFTPFPLTSSPPHLITSRPASVREKFLASGRRIRLHPIAQRSWIQPAGDHVFSTPPN